MSNIEQTREVRSFLMPRDPSIDRRFRPCPERQVCLYKLIAEEEEDDDSRNSIDDDTASVSSYASAASSNSASVTTEGALIYLRMRPVDNFCPSYRITQNILVTTQHKSGVSAGSNKNDMEKHFVFTNIFDQYVSQSAVYETCVRNKIETDENFTVLTYGTSGSGKTHTLLGDLENPGVIPRALENIFTLYANNIYPQPAVKIDNAKLKILDDDEMQKENLMRRTLISDCHDILPLYRRAQQRIAEGNSFETRVLDNQSIFIWVSFVEIYNELVFDLLRPNPPVKNNSTIKRKTHKIVSNDGKVFIKDLTSVYVKSAAEAYKLLSLGLQKVEYAATAINSNSSRSHCIFFVDVIKFSQPDIFESTCYRFCDLAGSERLAKTGNVGSRLKEAQRINTSLMVLGRCLDAANSNQKKKNADVIPFRESKLTMLLQSSLLGKEKLAMIVNITPTEQYFEENLNVLGFSSIAKNIIFKPVQEQSRCRYSWFAAHASDKSLVSNTHEFDALFEENTTLRSEIERLNGEIGKLERLLIQQEIDLRKQLVDNFQETQKERKKRWEERLEREIASIKRLHESKLSSTKANYEEKIEDLMEEIDHYKRENARLRAKVPLQENNSQSDDVIDVKKLRITIGEVEHLPKLESEEINSSPNSSM